MLPRAIVFILVWLAGTECSLLTWNLTNDPRALCNDFTRAGFFHRRGTGGGDGDQKWVVFLESGSLCYSSETCNRRYFQSYLRDRYSTDVRGENIFGNFDTESAWAATGGAGQPLTQVVNPLMTSLNCFRNETQFFSSSEDHLAVEGRDILSSNCKDNPTFCNHGHVLVPYCSSDLWLGSDTRLGNKTCECWDQDCFRYNPTSEDLQFTFRGQTIFQSVLQTLDRLYNLQTASEIVLVGSSAGGVGVLNSVKWVSQTFQNVTLKVITDSSWFINFRDSIKQEFGTVSKKSTHFSDLLEVVGSNEACSDMRLGYPCCLSAECVILERSKATREPYYPPDVPMFVLTSIYDIFLLANSLAGLVPLSDQLSTAGLALQFTTTLGEYGGVMNDSLLDTAVAAERSGIQFTYFAPQCFQHIYFSSSSLRGQNGILGADEIKLGHKFAMFRHSIEPGVWQSDVRAYYGGKQYTIRDAIDYWHNQSDYIGEGVAFREACSGPHCSSSCPEEVLLAPPEETEKWSLGARAAIACVVLLIAVCCLLLKMYCCLWLRMLHRKQEMFLKQAALHQDEEMPPLPAQRLRREFPSCDDNDAISVACLDLHYYITVRHHSEKTQSGNKESHIMPAALTELQDDEGVDIPDNVDSEGTCTETSQPEQQLHNKTNGGFTAKAKKILSGISAYFNPGELIAIMGPSGCGKTTFLDLLTGRRKTGNTMGNIFVNGTLLEKNRNWYISNTGYVLQLAAPYYEELTVRENLTLAAWVKLHISSRDKFQRVEQVMEVTGLMDLANTVVGGATGPGLSGGQKRRLVVALQLLKLPSVIFLDEPTSGLDSASSTELLTHLNALAASNRTVVLTIHQPRLEIFHMFHRIVVLTDGKIAYHGVPEKAYEVFVDALQSAFLSQGVKIPPMEDHNPADIIMDMLGDRKMRKIVNRYYEDSGEPRLVRKAVDEAWRKEHNYNTETNGKQTLSNRLNTLRVMVQGSRRAGRTQNYSAVRLAALEARAMKRARPVTLLYLPVIFFGYGFLLGTVYFQTTEPFLVMSGFCVYSVASALFMFPALYTFYTPALQIYAFEHADGSGRATDLVIQPFVRFISMAFFPVIICAGVLYVLLVDFDRWNGLEFLQVALVNLALNQTWTALLIWLILTFPIKAFRLSPVISALAGFTSGFFIPIEKIPWWYRWLSFINPNYYGFSASAVILLSDFESDCERDGGSQLQCYTSSGDYILSLFNFHEINPYANIVVLLGMTVFFLVFAGISNWIRYLKPGVLAKKVNIMLNNKTLRRPPTVRDTVIQCKTDERPSLSDSEGENLSDEDDEEEMEEQAKGDTCSMTSEDVPSQAKMAWMRVLERYKENECRLSQEDEDMVPDAQLRTTAKTQSIRQKQEKRKALYLVSGQRHSVWIPGQQTSIKRQGFTDVVMEVVQNKQDLKARQKRLRSRVMATQLVLKVQREELDDAEREEGEREEEVRTPTSEKKMWQRVIKKVIEENTKAKRKKRTKRSFHFHEVVSQYAEKMDKSGQDEETVRSTTLQAKAEARHALRQWRSQYFGRPGQSKRTRSLNKFSSLTNIQTQAPETRNANCDTIAEENEEDSSL